MSYRLFKITALVVLALALLVAGSAEAKKPHKKAKHVAKANGAIVEKFEKERKASAWKGSDKALKVEIDWRVAKPQVDGMPPEFYEGLKLVRAALLAVAAWALGRPDHAGRWGFRQNHGKTPPTRK